jgi:divalent metal cation (Fe/Co/Zn/Cd) transporter
MEHQAADHQTLPNDIHTEVHRISILALGVLADLLLASRKLTSERNFDTRSFTAEDLHSASDLIIGVITVFAMWATDYLCRGSSNSWIVGALENAMSLFAATGRIALGLQMACGNMIALKFRCQAVSEGQILQDPDARMVWIIILAVLVKGWIYQKSKHDQTILRGS